MFNGQIHHKSPIFNSYVCLPVPEGNYFDLPGIANPIKPLKPHGHRICHCLRLRLLPFRRWHGEKMRHLRYVCSVTRTRFGIGCRNPPNVQNTRSRSRIAPANADHHDVQSSDLKMSHFPPRLTHCV